MSENWFHNTEQSRASYGKLVEQIQTMETMEF